MSVDELGGFEEIGLCFSGLLEEQSGEDIANAEIPTNTFTGIEFGLFSVSEDPKPKTSQSSQALTLLCKYFGVLGYHKKLLLA